MINASGPAAGACCASSWRGISFFSSSWLLFSTISPCGAAALSCSSNSASSSPVGTGSPGSAAGDSEACARGASSCSVAWTSAGCSCAGASACGALSAAGCPEPASESCMRASISGMPKSLVVSYCLEEGSASGRPSGANLMGSADSAGRPEKKDSGPGLCGSASGVNSGFISSAGLSPASAGAGETVSAGSSAACGTAGTSAWGAWVF